jgi:hypothetical protein
LATLHSATVVCLDIFLGTDDGEGHGGDQATGMVKRGFIVLLQRRLVDLDSLGLNNSAHLTELAMFHRPT